MARGVPIVMVEAGGVPVTPTHDGGPLVWPAETGLAVTVADDSTPVVIAGYFPRAEVRPSISGDFIEDETLTCDPGEWWGEPTFEYQWLRDGEDISGADSDTYTLVEADVGAVVSCRVTGTNDNGSASALASGSQVEAA